MRRSLIASAVLATLATSVLAAGCGSGHRQPDGRDAPAAVATAAGAVQVPRSAQAPSSRLTSAWVCTLLEAGDVRAVLGTAPAPAPQEVTASRDVSEGRCAWDSDTMTGDLSVSVLEGHSDLTRLLILGTLNEGEPLPGVGERATVNVQGTYDVEVNAVVGSRRITVTHNGVDAATRKDAVIAAARAAAGRLR